MSPETETVRSHPHTPAPSLMPPRKPRNIVGLTIRICRECFSGFPVKRCDQHFCDERCRRDWHARIEARRTELYSAAMAMRSKTKGAFSRLTNLADRYIAEDRRREAAIAEAQVQMEGG